MAMVICGAGDSSGHCARRGAVAGICDLRQQRAVGSDSPALATCRLMVWIRRITTHDPEYLKMC